MKKILSLFVGISLIASLVACGGSTNSQSTGSGNQSASSSTEATYKIGGIGPITGGAAIYGQAVQRGIQIAVDEINANGGINGSKIEFCSKNLEKSRHKKRFTQR